MLNLNKIMIAGNLVADPRTAFTQQGSMVCNLRVAVNRKSRGGGDEVCYFDVAAWGKLAEACSKYLQKGSPVFVEGYMRQENWTDARTGTSKSKLSVIAEGVQFLPSSKPSAPAENGVGQDSAGSGVGQWQSPTQDQTAAPARERQRAKPLGLPSFVCYSDRRDPRSHLRQPAPSAPAPASNQAQGESSDDSIPF